MKSHCEPYRQGRFTLVRLHRVFFKSSSQVWGNSSGRISNLSKKKMKFEMGRVIVSSLEENEFTGHSWQIEYNNVFNFSSFHSDQSALTL